MTKLVFGVIDIPYANAPRAKGSKAQSGTQTTGDVATWLEQKYHVMEVFAETTAPKIVKELENSIAGALENTLLGAPAPANAFASATGKIEQQFKAWLSAGSMDALGYPGVPTGAALRGVSHRFKHPYARRAPRPSFIDTGLYQSSSKVWVETK